MERLTKIGRGFAGVLFLFGAAGVFLAGSLLGHVPLHDDENILRIAGLVLLASGVLYVGCCFPHNEGNG